VPEMPRRPMRLWAVPRRHGSCQAIHRGRITLYIQLAAYIDRWSRMGVFRRSIPRDLEVISGLAWLISEACSLQDILLTFCDCDTRKGVHLSRSAQSHILDGATLEFSDFGSVDMLSRCRLSKVGYVSSCTIQPDSSLLTPSQPLQDRRRSMHRECNQDERQI
jgi:hypothetical protein